MCRLYEEKMYCHLYWIPLCEAGPSRELVKCLGCGVFYGRDAYDSWNKKLQAANTAWQNIADIGEKKIRDFLHKEDFPAAETLSRQLLISDKNNLKLMGLLQMAINGQESSEEKLKEADQVASTMKFHWIDAKRARWIAEGRPKAGDTFPKKVVKAKRYQIVANEYYEPEPVEKEVDSSVAFCEAHYKFLVTPHQDEVANGLTNRLFKLVETRDKLETRFELVELFPDNIGRDGGKIMFSHGNRSPDFRAVTRDLTNFLDGPAGEKTGPTVLLPEIV